MSDISKATQDAMIELFCDISEGVEITIRKLRTATPEDLIQAVRIADDEVYATYGHRMAELFLVW